MHFFDPTSLDKTYKPKKKPEFVKIDPRDSTVGLSDVFYTHPDKLVPHRNSDGEMEYWGLNLSQGMERLQRRMQTQFIYMSFGKDQSPSPENQFIHRLMENKEKKMQLTKEKSQELSKCDFILHISMPLIEPKIYRKVKVSGKTTLFNFQDKILTPLMGWVRNYHGYIFVDEKDGTCFGMKGGSFIDMMHIEMHGIFIYMDDKSYTLSDLLQAEGEKMRYIYDLGDHWKHVIVLEKIVPASESDGKVVVLEGANACPPEDSNGLENKGNESYAEALKKKKINYKEASQALNVAPRRFDPTYFSLKETQQRVLDALNSKNSTGEGKKFTIPMGGFNPKDFAQPKKGEILVNKPMGSNAFMQETVSTQKDQKGLQLCANCGSPNNLKNCSACKMIKYCCRECQRQHWATHKKDCKK